MAKSPSTRRAWIEIKKLRNAQKFGKVALHPEGVDRNDIASKKLWTYPTVALHPEGVDRNISIALIWVGEVASPST